MRTDALPVHERRDWLHKGARKALPRIWLMYEHGCQGLDKAFYGDEGSLAVIWSCAAASGMVL